MTTATMTVGNGTMDVLVRPKRSLEELVDRIFAAMGLGVEQDPATVTPGTTRSIHEARRLRQAGDVDGALAVLASVDMRNVGDSEARWIFSEWKQMVRRRFGGRGVVLYCQGTGRAAALAPLGDGKTLEVTAVVGMRWQPGKFVSGSSLRGLRPLVGGA